MSLAGRKVLEEEIHGLRSLLTLMDTESECLARRDREGLVKAGREKDALARRLERSALERSQGPAGAPSGNREPGLEALSRERRALLERLRARNRGHREMLEAQSEQVGQLIEFFRNLRSRSALYDHKGKMKQP